MRFKTPVLAIALIWLLSLVEASAFYDPGVQRWINRDPLGDLASLPYQVTGTMPWGESSLEHGLTRDEAQSVWYDVNRNLFGAIGNDPVNGIDFFGLERVLVCTRPGPNGMPIPVYAEKETLGKASIGTPTDNAPTGSSDAFAAQMAKSYTDLASLAGAHGLQTLGKQLPKVGQKLFGGGGLLNSNRYLRIGFSRDGGRKVFRVAGDWVGKFKKDPHIVIKDCGPL